MILSAGKGPGPGSVVMREGNRKRVLFELGEDAFKELRLVSRHIDLDAAECLDFMVCAFADCEAFQRVFAGYVADHLCGSRFKQLPVQGVAITEGHFVRSFVEGDFEKNLATLERRWGMNGGKVLSVALRLAVDYFQAEAARKAAEIEGVPF